MHIRKIEHAYIRKIEHVTQRSAWIDRIRFKKSGHYSKLHTAAFNI